MRKPWTYPEERRLKAMAESGEPAAVIAKTLGRSKNSIYDKAQRLGVPLPFPRGEHNPKTKVPDDVIVALRLLHKSGICPWALASFMKRHFNVCPSYVQYVCSGERRQEVA